jgi:hypothetical protein
VKEEGNGIGVNGQRLVWIVQRTSNYFLISLSIVTLFGNKIFVPFINFICICTFQNLYLIW